MHNISMESIQRLINVQSLINNIEVKGNTNIMAMANTMSLLKNVLDELQETLNKEQNIVIDNTKEVKNVI